MATIITVLLVLLVIGVALWLFENFVTVIDPKIKSAIIGLSLLFVGLWLINLVLCAFHIFCFHGGLGC